MAEKKSAVSFDSVMRDLKAGKYSPVYILMGDEPYYIDLICNFISENALGEEERDFNQTVVFGADTTAAKIADMARRYPMMAERQVVVVKEAQAVKHWDGVERYLEKPQPTTVLVICHKNGTIDGRKKIVALAQKNGVVFTSNKKRERDLPPFIETYLRQYGVGIDHKAAQMIADHIGSDISRIAGELDKLRLSMTGEEKYVTPELVERNIGISKDYNPYELRNAVVQKNVMKANRIMKYFCSNPKSGGPYVLMPQLFSFFQNMMIAYYAPDRNNEEAMARHLGLRSGWAARDYITGIRNYQGKKVLEIISKIRETDARIKGIGKGNATDSDLMQELVYFILH